MLSRRGGPPGGPPPRTPGTRPRPPPPEREAEEQEPWLERANNGKAVERETAQDSWVRQHFEHQGGAGRPDFVSRATGQGYEVTTTNPSTIAAHLRRSYVSVERMVNYVMWTFGG